MRKNFQQTISSILVMMLAVAGFWNFIPQKAQATDSIQGYITNLSPVISKMPGCTQAIGGSVKDLFSKVKDLFSSKESDSDSSDTSELNANGQEIYSGDSGGGDSVPVVDQKAEDLAQQANDKLDAAKKAQEKLEQSTNCLNSIGKAIGKVLNTKSTDSILSWVNTGNDGNPLYVQDQQAYFKDISKQEIQSFGSEISDPELYPFGKNFMQNQAIAAKLTFDKIAQYSLDSDIANSSGGQYSATDFQGDFSKGGWSAWDSMIQNEANNPLGFSMMASNEIQKRIEEKTQSAKDELAQSGGYLGDKKCADPEGLTKEEDDAGKAEREASDTGPYQHDICNKWETVTPGKEVGEQASFAIDQKNQSSLDNINTLNDAMGAILDAVLAKFSSTLQTQGLASVTPTDNPYETNQNAVGMGGFQNEKDFTKAEVNSSAWLKNHPDFDIRTDLTQGLVDEQRVYFDKLKKQNDELLSQIPATVDFPLGNYGLIPTLYQLDYCIPGPHPGWENDAQANLQEAEDKVIDLTGMNFQQIADATGYTANNFGLQAYELVQALPFVGGSVTTPDSLDQYAKIIGGGPCATGSGYSTTITDCIVRQIYEPKFKEFTHIELALSDEFVNTHEKFISALENIFNQYVTAIKTTYDLNLMPDVAKENTTLFNKIPGYYKIFNNNKKTMDSINGIIARVIEIKRQVDILNGQLKDSAFLGPDGQPVADQEAQYEQSLLPWKLAFARLSTSLYSGDDIAAVDTLTKQVVDERDYVFKNLISVSPTSCEKEMKNWRTQKPQKWLSGGANLDRPDYPEPHLYNYPNTSDITPVGPVDDPVKGFLWYGAYDTGHGSRSKANDMCYDYADYAGIGSEGDCDKLKGPNFIHIDVDPDRTQNAGLIGSSIKSLPDEGNFERDILKMY